MIIMITICRDVNLLDIGYWIFEKNVTPIFGWIFDRTIIRPDTGYILSWLECESYKFLKIQKKEKQEKKQCN